MKEGQRNRFGERRCSSKMAAAYIESRTNQGTLVADVMAHFNVTEASARANVKKAETMGLVVAKPAMLVLKSQQGGRGCGQRLAYFAPQHVPTELVCMTREHGREGEPIILSTTRITICPSGTDDRFTFTPKRGWRGQITKDWRERRLAEVA